MSDPTITTIDNGSVALGNNVYRDDGVKFAGADTYVEGTILARKLVSDTITVTPDGGNTGDHTLAAATQAGRTLKIGTYVLLAGTLSSGVGPWTLTDPDGISETYTTTGATEDMSFPHLGVDITVTAGTTNFVTGDTADVVTTAESGLPLVAYIKDTGTNGAQTPVAVMPYELEAAGAGTLAARPIVGGDVNADRLVIDADGDASNVDDAVLDLLKASSINAIAVTQLSKLDPGAS